MRVVIQMKDDAEPVCERANNAVEIRGGSNKREWGHRNRLHGPAAAEKDSSLVQHLQDRVLIYRTQQMYFIKEQNALRGREQDADSTRQCS